MRTKVPTNFDQLISLNIMINFSIIRSGTSLQLALSAI